MKTLNEPTALYVSALTIYQLGKEGSLRKDIVKPRLGEAEQKCKSKIQELEAEIKAYETVLKDIQDMYFDEVDSKDNKTYFESHKTRMTTFFGKKEFDEMQEMINASLKKY